RGSDLPASRERDRAGGRGDEADVLEVLGARRASVRREREDVEVGRQRLYGAGCGGEGLSAVSAALSVAVVALSQAAQLHLDGRRAGRRGPSARRRLSCE